MTPTGAKPLNSISIRHGFSIKTVWTTLPNITNEPAKIGPPNLAVGWAPITPPLVILGPRLRALLWQAEYIPHRFHVPTDQSGIL